MINKIRSYYDVANGNNYGKYFLYLVLGFIAVNLVILNIKVFLEKPKLKSVVPFISSTTEKNVSCPGSCISEIQKATSSVAIVPTLTMMQNPTQAPTQTPIPILTPTSTPTPASASFVKEFFIPLGYGFGNSSDWKVVSGMEAAIDISNYSSISSATFEATIRIPNGNQMVWVRLYNATTYQSFTDSELFHEGGTPVLAVSKPITLTSGKYQVQLKTQLKDLAYIDQARIRIKIK